MLTPALARARCAASVIGSSRRSNALPPSATTIRTGSSDPLPDTGLLIQPIMLQATEITARNNAQTFKTAGATIVVKNENERPISTVHGNNGVGNGVDPQPPGNPPINDGPGTGPGNPGNKGGKNPG